MKSQKKVREERFPALPLEQNPFVLSNPVLVGTGSSCSAETEGKPNTKERLILLGSLTSIKLSYYLQLSLWRNRLARSAVNRKVGGSSPPRDELFFLFFFLYKDFIFFFHRRNGYFQDWILYLVKQEKIGIIFQICLSLTAVPVLVIYKFLPSDVSSFFLIFKIFQYNIIWTRLE